MDRLQNYTAQLSIQEREALDALRQAGWELAVDPWIEDCKVVGKDGCADDRYSIGLLKRLER